MTPKLPLEERIGAHALHCSILGLQHLVDKLSPDHCNEDFRNGFQCALDFVKECRDKLLATLPEADETT